MNSPLRNKFINTLSNRLGLNYNQINNIIASSNDDREIYDKLSENKKLSFQDKQKAFEYRAAKRLEAIVKIFDELHIDNNFNRYLDIGSDDCMIPGRIAKYLELSKKDAFGSDITNKCISKDITFIKLTPFVHSKLYTQDNIDSFDLVTAFQSLHHIEDRDFRLEEISNICMKDAVFILREHDAVSNLLKMIIDIEHALYDIVIDEMEYEEFVDSYYASYMNRDQLKDLLEKFGFKNIYEDDNKTITNIYYSVFIKIV